MSAEPYKRLDGLQVVTAPEPIPLRCPYCGGELEFELTYTASRSYSEHRDLTGIECEDFPCNARWTNRGEVERLPGTAP